PGVMRLCKWDEQLRLASTNIPQNLGYFFYCDGNCFSHAWNDDPSIPTDDNIRPASIPSHFRRFCAQHDIGIDIVKRTLVPTIQVEYNTENAKPDDWISFNVLVHNVRDASWFLKPDDLKLKHVKVTIQAPSECVFDSIHSFPATVDVGDIEADQVSTIEW